jgi:hypothetical protein
VKRNFEPEGKTGAIFFACYFRLWQSVKKEKLEKGDRSARLL